MLSIKFCRNAGFIIWIIAVISFVAFLNGKLDIIYVVIINTLAMIGEIILISIVIKRSGKTRTITDALSCKVSLPKCKFSDKEIKAGKYIFDEPIISTNPARKSVFKICIEPAEKIVESLEISVARIFGTDTSEEKIDITHLGSDGIHILHINAHPKEKLNFKFNRDIKVKLFSVEELYIP